MNLPGAASVRSSAAGDRAASKCNKRKKGSTGDINYRRKFSSAVPGVRECASDGYTAVCGNPRHLDTADIVCVSESVCV